ncbi:MAG TPA: hypothetical protein VFM36_03865 [Thermoanaerobaculia bacterium]|nr:hypothetical protein [Thermoanaerobaculia bacterium]
MRCFAVALLLIAPAAVQARSFNDPACHVKFDVPRGWAIEIDKTKAERVCEITMEPRNREELLEKDDGVWLHGVSIEVVKGDLDTVIRNDGSFELQEGAWVILGRQGIASPASEITGNGWKGLTGISESGCHFEEGGYAGLCPVAVAMVSNGTWSAIVIGGPSSHGQFDRVLKSLRFR